MSEERKAVVPLHKREEEKASKIEVIKDLIFGEHIEAYDAEFETLRTDILHKKRLLEELIQEVGSDLRKSIDHVSLDVHMRIDRLEESLEAKIGDLQEDRVSRRMLGSLLKELGEKISNP